jgi:hypothetical protein
MQRATSWPGGNGMYGKFACADGAVGNEAGCDRRPSSESPALATFGSCWDVPCDVAVAVAVDVNLHAAAAALTKYDNTTIRYTQSTSSSSSSSSFAINRPDNFYGNNCEPPLPASAPAPAPASATASSHCSSSSVSHKRHLPNSNSNSNYPSNFLAFSSRYLSIEPILHPAPCSCTRCFHPSRSICLCPTAVTYHLPTSLILPEEKSPLS